MEQLAGDSIINSCPEEVFCVLGINTDVNQLHLEIRKQELNEEQTRLIGRGRPNTWTNWTSQPPPGCSERYLNSWKHAVATSLRTEPSGRKPSFLPQSGRGRETRLINDEEAEGKIAKNPKTGIVKIRRTKGKTGGWKWVQKKG